MESLPKTEAPALLSVDVAAMEGALAAVEADTKLQSAIKELVRPKYQEVIEAAKGAVQNTARAATYREDLFGVGRPTQGDGSTAHTPI